MTTISRKMKTPLRQRAASASDRGTVRILHVVRTLNAGGLEVGLVNLVRGLRGGGFQQAVCCLEEKGELASQLPEDVPVWSCRSAKPSRWKRHELKAASIIREYRPQVVHARNYGAWIDAAFA
ncbi:MAG: glycosyltransferase, partial [Planctomycetaceae bacterium]